MKPVKLAPEIAAAWSRIVARARTGDDIHITSDRRREVITKIDALLCGLRFQHALEAKEAKRNDAA